MQYVTDTSVAWLYQLTLPAQFYKNHVTDG